jgi:hypothetical protein
MQHSLESDDLDPTVAPGPCRLVSIHSAPTSIPVWRPSTSSPWWNTAQPTDDKSTPNHKRANNSGKKRCIEGIYHGVHKRKRVINYNRMQKTSITEQTKFQAKRIMPLFLLHRLPTLSCAANDIFNWSKCDAIHEPSHWPLDLSSVGLERGRLRLVSTTEELNYWNTSCVRRNPLNLI